MKKFLLSLVALLGFAQGVFAAGSLTVPTFDTTDFMAVAGAVLVASVAFWGVRKALRLIGA